MGEGGSWASGTEDAAQQQYKGRGGDTADT